MEKTAIQQGREEKTLNMRVSYYEGVMTRKEWLNMQKSKGAKSDTKQVPSVRYNRIKFNRMDGDQQKEYEAKMNILKTEYRLYTDENSFFDITKIEYEYFNSL